MKMYIFVILLASLLSVKGSGQYESPSSIYTSTIRNFNSVAESFGDSYSTLVKITENNDDEGVIELTDRYPSALWNIKKEKATKIRVKAEDGYKIAVSIIECSFDGQSSYVKISPDKNMNSDDTLLFAYKVEEKFTYLFNSSILYVDVEATKTSNNFTANFTRFGEKAVHTTTPIPTTTIILPTPGKNDSSEITVFIEGLKPSEYKKEKVFNALRQMILGMATEYCDDQLFPLVENITIHNIVISKLSACSKNWHNAERCISLRFSIPVELEKHKSSMWSGYQMNSNHLRIMWDKYSSKYLEGLWIYDSPDESSSLTWEISISIMVIICFAAGLVALRYILVAKKRQRKMSDAVSIVSSTRKVSELSLSPHYLQEAPPLFDTTYTMYDPTVDDAFASQFEFSEFKRSNDNITKRKASNNSDEEESGA